MNARLGIIGVLVVTTVTGFMVMYNSTSRNAFTLASPKHRAAVTPATQPKTRPTRDPIAVLRGYTNVVDQKPLKMHCSSCSLVSSSGQLTGGGRGQEIDRAECVIRMNDAPSGGLYQRDVGRRTSLRVVAHSSLRRLTRSRTRLLDASPDAVFVFWGPAGSMRRDGRGPVYNSLRRLKRLLPRLQMYVVTQAKMGASDELFKNETGMDRRGTNSWLSTGWFTVRLATELCSSVAVYGMVPPDYCSNSSVPRFPLPYHYYEPRGVSECSTYLAHERGRQGGHHRFITEKAVFARWARTHDIRFYQPDWTPGAGLLAAAPVAAATGAATTTEAAATHASHTTRPDRQEVERTDGQADRRTDRQTGR